MVAHAHLREGAAVARGGGFARVASGPAITTRICASVLYDGPPRMMR